MEEISIGTSPVLSQEAPRVLLRCPHAMSRRPSPESCSFFPTAGAEEEINSRKPLSSSANVTTGVSAESVAQFYNTERMTGTLSPPLPPFKTN